MLLVSGRREAEATAAGEEVEEEVDEQAEEREREGMAGLLEADSPVVV